MPCEDYRRGDFLLADVPQSHGFVLPARCERLAVGTECRCPHRPVLVDEKRALWHGCAGFGLLVKSQRAARVADREPPSICRKTHADDGIRLLGCAHELHAIKIPDADELIRAGYRQVTAITAKREAVDLVPTLAECRDN